MTLLVPHGFTPASDASHADWIVHTLKPWGKDRVRLWSFLPDAFESYARVLHPAYRVSGNAGTVRWANLAARNDVRLGPATGFRKVSGVDPNDQAAWDAAAPNEGTLEREQIADLAELLAASTRRADRCWLGAWEGWGSWRPGSSATLVAFRDDASTGADVEAERGSALDRTTQDAPEIDLAAIPRVEIPSRAYFLFSARLRDIPTFEVGGWHQAPNIWWPDDRAWCVVTEIDGFSTYVGGTAPCIAALLASEAVEAIEVSADVPMDPGPY